MSVRILLVGGGRMGEALLGGMLAAGREPSEFAVAEVYAPRREELAEKYPGVAGRRGARRRRGRRARHQAG